MSLNKALKEKEERIIKRWENKLIESYPEDTQRFLKTEKDQFANPVGYTIRNEIRNLYDGFVNQDKSKINSSLSQIIKIRAVQDFSPSAALYFILELKNIIKEETEWGSYNNEEREELDERISSLLLEAFDIYEQCRYKLYELRVNEIKNQVSGLLRMANLVYEIPEITSK
jgi:ribosomal protein S17E